MGMYIERVTLIKLRCFSHAVVDFDLSSGTVPLTMIMGDNASGKTTFLKAIALGLCDWSSAAGLLRESEEGYIRTGETQARIRIDLVSSEDVSQSTQAPQKKYIEAYIVDLPNGDVEIVPRHLSQPKRSEFPWREIFACGYGAGRGTSGTGDFANYSLINSVYSLFNYSEGLQNPELTIRRLQAQDKDQDVLSALETILRIDRITMARGDQSERGIVLRGPWGYDMPLRDLADGYKSTFLWVTDLIGWALTHQPNVRNLKEIVGIVLIDEIEQHLHPKWQRGIIATLREQFPKIQFITTTHSPLVARSVGQIGDNTNPDQLLHFKLGPSNNVEITPIKSMKGWRSDQILASEAFDWLVDADPDVEAVMKRASELVAKGDDRSSSEDAELEALKFSLSSILLSEGQTLIERTIESERYKEITEEIRALRRQLDL